MSTSEPPEGARQVPVVWVGAEELPISFVNQFVGVVQPNEVFLTLGALVPPAILASNDEERKAQIEAISYVPVKPVARFAMTPARLSEFIGVLQETLANYEKQKQQLEGGS